MKNSLLFLIILLPLNLSSSLFAQTDSLSNELRVIMRADDIGFSHAANTAIIRGYKEGVITSTEILVVGPWFLEAAIMLKENPGLDVGIHLALTSEWDNYKWGPISMSSTLVNDDGYFPPDNASFLSLKPNLKEIENELRAQVKLGLKYIPHVSHLSFHMGTAGATAELLEIATKISAEFNLPLEGVNVDFYEGLWAVPLEDKEGFLLNVLQNLKPGTTVVVFHLADNNSESQSITAPVYDANLRMALHREAETITVTSSRVKELIRQRNIKLIGYNFKEKVL